MSRLRNKTTGVVVSVDDSKDERFDDNWEQVDAASPKRTTRKSTAGKSEK